MPNQLLHWKMQVAEALQQRQALHELELSQRSMVALGESCKTSESTRLSTASPTHSFESGGRSRLNPDCSFDEEDVESWSATQTTVMMRNIPNSYSRTQLL